MGSRQAPQDTLPSPPLPSPLLLDCAYIPPPPCRDLGVGDGLGGIRTLKARSVIVDMECGVISEMLKAGPEGGRRGGKERGLHGRPEGGRGKKKGAGDPFRGKGVMGG